MRKNVLKLKETYQAIAHVVWIMIISLAIILAINGIVNDSNTSQVISIILILAYIIFSFARKYWTNGRQKVILGAVDTTITLACGMTIIMTCSGMQQWDIVGDALINNTINNKVYPNIEVFYLGTLLVVVGIIKAIIVHKNRIKFKMGM